MVAHTSRNLAVGLLLALAAALAPGAHAQPGAAPQDKSTGHSSRPPGVDWFEGDVADAFSSASASGKPVFLYWGAAWCPPCQELKATIFKRQDFRDRLQLFVPVYLDGDAKGAQAWGERFHISGYPTVLVLRADRTELERVSGGMDLSRYAEVLDLALGQGRPVQELLAPADAAGQQAAKTAAEDCRRLAYNGWMLDDAWSQHPESLGTLAGQLAQAAELCPPDRTVERTRLQMTAVHAAVRAQAKALAGGAAPSAQLLELLEPVPGVLADRDLAEAVGDTLWFLPAEFFGAAASVFAPQDAKRGREILRRLWFALMDRLADDPRYSAADRIDALRSKALAAKSLSADGKVPPALAAAVTKRIDEALAREHEPYARASLVNSALNVLEVLGDDKRAHDILAGEIKTSAYAYYYMPDLADLEEKLGHTDQAVEWLARSYREAQGPATRFQWGVGYVRGLVRMRPQDEPGIRDAALAVLGDLDASGDLHGRTLRSLKRLETSLQDWGKDASHAAAIEAVRQRVQAICGRIPADDSARPACAGFLASS
jgi:thioredoxin-like negative regulator of GroEL